MKTIYFETIDSPSAAIYKIYGVYQRMGHLPLKQIHYFLVLSPICKYQTLSLIRVFQRTSQTHMNTHTSINIYTGCIKKMVIELWSALARSLYNLQKSFFHSRKDQAFSFRMSPFL